MKNGKFDRKKICKNRPFSASPKYIRSRERKKPDIAAVWGHRRTGNSDKESSHVVGKSSERG